jgi:hypothetical protein
LEETRLWSRTNGGLHSLKRSRARSNNNGEVIANHLADATSSSLSFIQLTIYARYQTAGSARLSPKVSSASRDLYAAAPQQFGRFFEIDAGKQTFNGKSVPEHTGSTLFTTSCSTDS